MRENVRKELLDIQKKVLAAGLLAVAGLLFVTGQAMAVPTLDIQANGSDGPITILPESDMSLSVGLDCGNMTGLDADWWLGAQTPSGWYYFDVAQGTWMPGTSFLIWQGPLFSFSNVELPGSISLPEGSSTFYFVIDTNMNGLLDADLYYDSVEVAVSSDCSNPNDIDNDGDGYTENQGDCNDNDPTIHPNATEICGDGIDQDCDGSDELANACCCKYRCTYMTPDGSMSSTFTGAMRGTTVDTSNCSKECYEQAESSCNSFNMFYARPCCYSW